MPLTNSIKKSSELKNLQGDLESAIDQLHQELTQHRFSKDYSLTAEAWQYLASLYLDSGEIPEAKKCVRNALRLARKAQNKELEADIWRIKTLITLTTTQHFGTAINQVQRGLRLLPRRTTKPYLLTKQTRLYALLGRIYAQQGNETLALRWLRRAYHDAKKIKNRQILVEIASDISFIYTNQGKCELAEKYINQALKIARREFLPLVPELLIRLAKVCIMQNQPERAKKFCLEGLKLARAQRQTLMEAEALETLGDIYLNMDRLEDSKEYFYNALDILDKLDHPRVEKIKRRL